MLLNMLIPEIDAREITFIDKEQHGFAFNEKKCIFDVYFGADHPERCRTTLEKLAFSLKYIASLQKRPDEMLEEIFKRLFDAAELAAMDAQTRKKVDKAMTTKIDILQGIQNSYVDGYEAGEKNQAWETARVLLDLDVEEDIIVKSTGLSLEDVRSLRN